MKNQDKPFMVYNLEKAYLDLGKHIFKVVLSPFLFDNSHECSASMKDTFGNEMNFILNKWGRKMNFEFIIDEKVPDGVSVVNLNLKDNECNISEHKLSFWIVKP